jgi:hypothetical protein
MGGKDTQQSMGLEILKPNDTTLWKRALKSKLEQSAKKREPISGRRGLLSGIWGRLKRSR